MFNGSFNGQQPSRDYLMMSGGVANHLQLLIININQQVVIDIN